jgi:hypothetical protein
MSDLHDRGARVVSVFGPFGSRVLVDMPVGLASELFEDDPLGECAPHNVIDSIQRGLDDMPPAVAGSALAAMALALGREIEHPYNSATSKSMCAKSLMEALDRLRAIAPPKQEADGIDDIAGQREKRRAAAARSAAT